MKKKTSKTNNDIPSIFALDIGVECSFTVQTSKRLPINLTIQNINSVTKIIIFIFTDTQ